MRTYRTRSVRKHDRASGLVARARAAPAFRQECVRRVSDNNPIRLRLMDTSNENDQANRAISNGKLHALLHFHTRPINVVVFHGSQGILVLRLVSRLDAFSGYLVRT